jgi:hypothetical protein
MVFLTRIDPTRNIDRFYVVDVTDAVRRMRGAARMGPVRIPGHRAARQLQAPRRRANCRAAHDQAPTAARLQGDLKLSRRRDNSSLAPAASLLSKRRTQRKKLTAPCAVMHLDLIRRRNRRAWLRALDRLIEGGSLSGLAAHPHAQSDPRENKARSGARGPCRRHTNSNRLQRVDGEAVEDLPRPTSDSGDYACCPESGEDACPGRLSSSQR